MNSRIAVPSRYGDRVPTAAAALSAAGALPFVAVAVVAWLMPEQTQLVPSRVIVAYGAVILSFLGGTIWGLTTAAAAGDPLEIDNAGLFAASVVPPLIAWGSLFLGTLWALIVLAAAFVVQLLVDRWVDRLQLVPPWWLRLRLLLTAVVVACLTAVAAAS